MRTVSELKAEILLQNAIRESKDSKPAQVRKAKKTVEHLNACIMYLQTNPTEQYLQRERDKIAAQIEQVSSRFDIWLSRQETKVKRLGIKARIKFEKEAGIPKLKNQLKTIIFLNGNGRSRNK